MCSPVRPCASGQPVASGTAQTARAAGCLLGEHALDEPVRPPARTRAGSGAGSCRCRRSRAPATRASRSPPRSPSCWATSIGPRVDAVALGEHELEQQQRPPLADVFDRLEQPLGDRRVAGRRRPEDRAVRPARAGLVARRGDQLALAEDLDRAVDERPAERPDRAELTRRRELSSYCPAMSRPLAEQRKHSPLPGSEIAITHH